MQNDSDMKFTKEPYIEDAGPRKIESMQFSMFDQTEIMKAAEAQVYKGDYYDGFRKPHKGGLLDLRLGAANKECKCETCGGKFAECPGHFGYLPLALAVFNPGYLEDTVKILKCICKSCSCILVRDTHRKDLLKKMRNPKIDHVRKNELVKDFRKKCSAMASKGFQCSKCGYVNGVVKKARSQLFIIHDREKLKGSMDESRSAISHIKEAKSSLQTSSFFLNPANVLALFKKISDEDCELLFVHDRPEKFLIMNFSVPPTAIRPSVIMSGSQSNENDVTEKLKHIIQANASLRDNLFNPSPAYIKLAALWEDLQVNVALYINSDVKCGPSANQTGKPLSGFVQRLKGKQGRFRGNLCGKRVEYTGRTVISPDPNLKITEVAIPIQMAQILTYPERVSSNNIEKLRQCVRNGPSKYPGARYIRDCDGNSRVLMVDFRKRIADELKFGDVVDRHIEDGDIVLFNRQPSLHRMSIMSHRARVMPWKTLSFNESVCNPYNADFDGDEMNMHVPQTEEARTEALMLMGVQNNLCTPKNGEILVASTQDFLTSSFLITRKDTFYDHDAFSQMCCYMGDSMDNIDLPTPAIIKPIELWTGKQLFSVLVRPNAGVRVYLNLTVEEKNYKKIKKNDRYIETMCPNDGFVYFRNSDLISGQLGKATLGSGNKNGLYSVLLRDYNAHAAAACMNRLAKLSARWIGNHGFSIGIDDVQAHMKLNQESQKIISDSCQKCDDHIKSYNEGRLELQPGCDAVQTLEAVVTSALNDIRDATGEVCMKFLHWRNSPLIMAQCGSKGSKINISQMVLCLGQQSVGGRRAPDGFIDRSLPHFPRNDKTPAAKGFVANSFYTGLRATEFFFHTMGGREGLVDTAVKTADTGYMSRRLIKALEDLSVNYDNTVRDASGCIVQFVYGDDGMDPATMEANTGSLNFERLLMKAKATCPLGGQKYLSVPEITRTLDLILPRPDKKCDKDSFDPSEAFKESLRCFVEDNCLKKLSKMLSTYFREGTSDPDEDSAKMFDSEVLSISNKISGISEQQLKVFLRTCISRYERKKIEAGTAIGAIGAQSIGEPGTQMTLKTFHFAGVASMNVTLGVPRIKEIINGAKNISTPIITADLERNDDVKFARMVKGRIEKTVLGQVAKSIKLVMTPRSGSIVIKLDMDIVNGGQLSVDANVVKESILQTPKLKLKSEHIKVLDSGKLMVTPQADRSKLHFELHTLSKTLSLIVVNGIKTVERVVITEGKEEGKETGKKKQYKLLVEGMGLQAVMNIAGVDGRKTVSNHIMEVRATLGIEASRTKIISEIEYIMQQHGMSIDKRHMMLLADLMTCRGEVLGITRYGIQKMGKSVLMLASFEKTADHLFNAAAAGRDDKIEGVSECIIMGIPMQLGTGMLKVIQRMEQDVMSICEPERPEPLLSMIDGCDQRLEVAI